VNRTGKSLASALVVGFFLTIAPAGAQVALVVGSVRDQHGSPIEGAAIVAFGARGSATAAATTDAVGTFSLRGDGIRSVAISCRYCRSQTVAVVPGEPVIGIVRRFDALFYDSPSPQDLANLPYAHVESAIALRPFTLLRQTTATVPGSQLADRGLLPSNALLIDAGVPDYDFSFGLTPYVNVPAAYEYSGSVASPADAFLYGDRAGSGIVTLEPFGGDSAVATGGGDTILRLESGSASTGVVAGTYSNDTESRQRADARWTVPLSDAQTLSFSGGSAQDRAYGDPTSTLAENFSFATAAFDDAQPSVDLHAAFVADRGGYLATSGGLPVGDVWSDAQYSAGLRTQGPVFGFLDLASRLSTGIYDASAYLQPRIAGTLDQNRIDAGVEASGKNYDVGAGVGFFGLGFTGGWGGGSTPADGHLATPSLSVKLFPNSKWSADLEASGSFTLPTLWEEYAFSDNYGAFVYNRNALYSANVSYTDDSRLRVSVESASQRVRGYTDGLVTSSGASLAWQIAPAISLRAWTMYVADTTAPPIGPTLYPTGTPSNVNALWLTYDNGPGLRIDAIYRRDLLDREPFEHVDASVSGPVANHLRWYAGVEDRQRTTYLDVGFRFR
jgi:hypothetical protein